MKARTTVLLIACVAALLLGGCKSTWDFWKENSSNVVKSNVRHFNRIHESLDRHFLNYDWSDPYID